MSRRRSGDGNGFDRRIREYVLQVVGGLDMRLSSDGTTRPLERDVTDPTQIG
jgi:hypothetical protein